MLYCIYLFSQFFDVGLLWISDFDLNGPLFLAKEYDREGLLTVSAVIHSFKRVK